MLLALAVAWPGVAKAQDWQAALERLRTKPPPGVSAGALVSTAYQFEQAERIAPRFAEQTKQWRARGERCLKELQAGRDPWLTAKGEIMPRAYRSAMVEQAQGYAIYLPPDYDARRRWPLYVALHGGSSNGNLFLGVVLGNNMPWQRYAQHLWDRFEPRWKPGSIVVAPDGFGQPMWRWMAERDVLDVIEDVQKHYAVDAHRIVLGGLSNGGVGAYAIGLRHAWRFAAVQAMAGAPSWLQYAGGRPTAAELRAMRPLSGLDLARNSTNTHFFYYHGHVDPGPMRPAFVQQFSERLKSLGIEPQVTWYDTGHDILYLVHRHGRIYERLAALQRPKQPSEVHMVSGDYRANRQHWLQLTRIAGYPSQATADAALAGSHLQVRTQNVRALSLHSEGVPWPSGDEVQVVLDGQPVLRAKAAELPSPLRAYRDPSGWHLGAVPNAWASEKRPGVSGPLTDAYYERMVHVYAAGDSKEAEALRQVAMRASRGWPLWLWNYQQPVLSDAAAPSEELLNKSHLVVYMTPRGHRWLKEALDRLPLRLEDGALTLGKQRFVGRDIGVRMIVPNPLAPDRYLIIQAGTSAKAVAAGNNLPDFLPDYVVYEAEAWRSRARLTAGSHRTLAQGYFDDRWRLPP